MEDFSSIRKKILIDLLIACSVFEKEDKSLLELSLTELEDEIRRYQSQSHPHSDFGSLRITGKKTKKKE
nr:Fur-regulated basic protein FbpA [Robertmurraya korlensis]